MRDVAGQIGGCASFSYRQGMVLQSTIGLAWLGGDTLEGRKDDQTDGEFRSEEELHAGPQGVSFGVAGWGCGRGGKLSTVQFGGFGGDGDQTEGRDSRGLLTTESLSQWVAWPCVTWPQGRSGSPPAFFS